MSTKIQYQHLKQVGIQLSLRPRMEHDRPAFKVNETVIENLGMVME